MNINKNIIIAFGALVLAVFAIISSFGGGGSVIAALTLRLIPMLMILSLLSKKLGYSILAISVCFIDFVKRLMILDSSISSKDIGYILVVPAAITIALSLPAIGRLIMNRRNNHNVYRLFLVVVAFNFVACLGLVLSGDIDTRGIQQTMNIAVFAHLVWLVPFLYREGWTRKQLVGPFLISGIIVAVYGVYQAIFGITSLEFDYIMSGHTMLIIEWRETWMRPFSTLSSVHGYSMTMAILFWMVSYTRKISFKKVFWAMLMLLVCGAVMSSMVRTAWLAWGLVLPLAFLLRQRYCIPVLYSGVVLVFTGLVLFSGLILHDLDSYQDRVEAVAGYSNTKLGRVAQVSTYSERLQGFDNFKNNPEMRTLFGYKGDTEAEELKSHDPLTSSMRDYGVIPVLLGLIVLSLIFQRVLVSLRSVLDIECKKRCALLLALSLSVMLTSLVSGGHLTVSPINVYWYLILGIYFVELLRCKENRESEESECFPDGVNQNTMT